MAATYDAIVVGGGHNGLVAAAYLARAGARTVVLEGRHKTGGAATTESPWLQAPEFKVTRLSYVMSARGAPPVCHRWGSVTPANSTRVPPLGPEENVWRMRYRRATCRRAARPPGHRLSH